MADLNFLPDAVEDKEEDKQMKAKRSDLSFLPDAGPVHDQVEENINLSADMDPEAEARQQQLSKDSGVPLLLVREQEEVIRKKFEEPDLGRIAMEAPRTLEFFSKLENAAVARDDHENLSRIERLWQGIKNTPARLARGEGLIPPPEFIKKPVEYSIELGEKSVQAFRAGRQNVEAGQLYFKKMTNTLAGKEDPQLDARITTFEKNRILSPVDDNFLETMATGASEMLPLLWETVKQGQTVGLQYAMVGGTGALVLGQMGPQVAAPEEVITVPAAAATMYGAGVKVGAFGAMLQLEGGLAFEEISKIVDEDGNPIDPRIAAVASLAVGGVNAGLEFVGLKYLPGGEKLLGKITSGSVAQALKNPSIRNALAKVAGKYVLGVTTETITEIAQEAMNILGSEVAKQWSEATEGTQFKDLDVWQDVVPRLYEAGKEAFAASLVLGAPATIHAGLTDVRTAQEARAYQEAVTQVNDAVNEGKLKERSPDKAKAHLDLVGAGEDVFISAEYFQQDPEKASRVMEQLGVDPKVAQHRAESGQDIAVPLSQMMTVLESEEFAELSKDIKPAPSAMTLREVEALDLKQEVEKVAEKAKQVNQEAQAVKTELSRIRKEVEASGYTPQYAEDYAATLERFADGMALEGRDRTELLQKIRIAGGQKYEETQTAKADQQIEPGEENLYEQLSRLPDPALKKGMVREAGSGRAVFNLEEAARALAAKKDDSTFYQGIEAPVAGRFMRGVQGKSAPPAADVVAANLNDKILNAYDQVKSIAEARVWAEQVSWLTPTVQSERKILRWKKNKEGFYGNEKMMFPTKAFPQGRNTWDIPGCGRQAWAVANGIDVTQACYGGACYAEVYIKGKQGLAAGVSTGVKVKPLRDAALRQEMNAYFKKHGLEKTQGKWPEYQVKINTTKSSKRFGQLSIGTVTDALPAAVVSTRLQSAKGQDIRLGVDTDGAAWLARPEVMDAILEADPRSLTVYVSAYHQPPPSHPLSRRAIINVTVSGWHPLPETLARLRWAEAVRANGWNVILREVVANPEQFDNATAAQYNRLHEALLKTDFFVMQQPLHRGVSYSKPMWGLPACCNGSHKHPHTCDQCEVNEGLGKKFREYWKIKEEDIEEETILPDLKPPKTFYQYDIEPEKLNQADEGKTPKGSLTITDDKYLISLFEGADLSTLLHETGHLFLSEFQYLAESGQASGEIQTDYRIVREWLGLKENQAFERSHHEQFARGFEAYLMEGKAPTAEMEGVFHRFKQWLRAVYRSVKNLNADLTDEVREVFDRMLSDRRKIVAAGQLNEMVMPTPQQMDAMGIVAEDRNYMERLLKQAYVTAEKQMVKERDRNRRKQTAVWRVQAEKEIAEDPVHRLIADLRKGAGVNREMLLEEYGLETVAAMPHGIVKKAGQPPEMVAASGSLFTSVDEMVRTLSQTPPRAEAVKLRTTQLAAEHDARYRAEDYLVTTDEYGAFLEIMAKYEDRDVRKVTPRKAFQIFARKELEQMEVRDAVRHDRFLASMKKYSRIEADKARQQKFDEAADANEKVRINYEMAGQAVRNRQTVEKTIKKIRRAAKSSTIAYPYHDNLLALAQRFGLGTPSMVPKDPAGKPALLDLLSDTDELIDNSGAFSEFLTNESFFMDYRRLTMAQMVELGHLVDFLIGRGRDAKKQMLSDKSMSIEQAAMEIATETQGLPTKKVWRQFSFMRRATDAARRYISMMDSLQFIAIALGGYQNIDKKGVKSRAEALLVDPLFAAQNNETVMFAEIYQQLDPHMKQIHRTIRDLHKRHGRRIRVSGVDTPALLKLDGQDGWWTAEQIFALALNMGNEGNIDRLYKGYPDLDTSQVARLLDLLGKEDWDAVQGIWDVIDSLYDDINQVYMKINHFPMDKVEATKVVTRFGEYRGGYYPVRFSPHLSSAESLRVAEFTEKDDLMSRAEAIHQVPANKSGMTKKRRENVQLPLKLSLSVATEHLRDTVHYITHAEAVRDVDRITRHHLVAEQAQRALGRQVYERIRPALAYIARPERDYPSDVDKAVEWLRGKTTPFILAWNASVALKQVFSSPAAAFDMGIEAYLNGFKIIFTSSPMRRYREMQELSPYMASRATAMDRELAGMFRRMKPDQRALYFGDKAVTWEDVRNFGFWPIRLMDTVAVLPIWHGAYQKALKDTGEIEKAVAYADNTVRKTQPSAQPIDLSHWQRAGGAVRLLSSFQTFTVGKYGQRQRLHYRAFRAGKMTAADYAWFTFMDAVLPAVGMQLLFAILWGRDLEDEETWGEILTGVMQYWLLTGLPVVNALWSPYSGPLDSPVAAGPDEMKKALENGERYLEELDDEALQKVLWSLFSLGSYISGVPASRVADKIVKGMEQDGETAISDSPVKYLIPAPKK